ncbi:MAG: molybdenum cofactor biosynthesis protein MoaE [Candidatus Thermoplasmatota archaeon]
MIKITNKNFSIDKIISKLKTKKAGCIVSFLGIVRGYSQNGKEKVTCLKFETHKEMALKKLSEIEKSAKKNFDIADIAIIHRIGKFSVSENIVLIAVSAKNRKEAFPACEYIINELKKVVPIWKKEVTEKGEYWVENDTRFCSNTLEIYY